MAKFSDIALGPLARRAVEFPLPSGRIVNVDVVALFGENVATPLKEARAFAQARGVSDPKDGDPLYELGIWVHTIALGVIDPESPLDNPRPFFDGGVAQILDERKGLGREWIALLFEAQQAWQDELAPRPKEMGATEYFASLLNIVEAPPGTDPPFFKWRHVLQSSWVRTTAALLLNSPNHKSNFGALWQIEAKNSENSAKPTTNGEPPKVEA